MCSAKRKALTSVAVCLAFMLACRSAFALDPSLEISQYAHTAWSVRDGFVKGEINAIAQTPDGYLWLGTEFGLLRFDGVRAVPWQPPPNQHLPSTIVYSLLVSRDGTLWIGTEKGLAIWKEGQLTTNAELAGQNITDLLQDREGSVWAGTYAVPLGKLCAIRNSGTACYGRDGEFGDGVFALYEDSSNTLWAGVRAGLWRWKPGPPKFYPLAEPEGIRAIGEDASSALLIGIGGGIKQFVNGRSESYPFASGLRQFKAHIRPLRDRDGGLWFGTADRGIAHIHQGKTELYTQADNLSGDYVNAIFEDREGNIWVGTRDGLDRFRDFSVATLSSSQGLSNNLVTAVLASKDGTVWMGSALGGLHQWKKGQLTTFGEPEPPVRRTDARTDAGMHNGRLNGAAPNALFEDRSGRIWVSTQRAVGYLAGNRFVPFVGVPGGQIPSMTDDIDGNLWIAHQDFGLFQLFGGKVVKQIPWKVLGHDDTAMVLVADSRGGLWLGFHDGGVAYFKDGQVRKSYAAADGLAEGRVTGLQLDEDGTLWVTAAGGMSRLRNDHFTTLSSKNGLPCDMVHGALRDDRHSLWVYMPCGLLRIPASELDAWSVAEAGSKDAKPTIHATIFDVSDGVRIHATGFFYSPQVARSLDGRLWFLTTDGVNVIDPHYLPFNKVPPPVHIEQITADHKTYDATPDGSGHLRLPPLIRDLTIDYTALSLVVPDKVHFRYKLEGQDKDWREVINDREVEYSNLRPGPYRFRVAACNNSGVWNETGASVDFSVAPAYYQTWWFRLSCLAALLSLLWAIHQLRLRQLAREFNGRMEARVNERTRIARELHDTLLQSFQGVLLFFQAASNQFATRPAEAKLTLDRAIDKAAQAVTEGRHAIQGLRSSTTETNSLAASLRSLGEELAGNPSNQNCAVVDVRVEGAPRELHPILRDDVFRIAGEALRNAFLHAQASKVDVAIRCGPQELQVRIRDDGKGIDPQFLKEKGRAGHWGLRGMHERAKVVGGNLEVWSKVDSGTEIQLSIPACSAYARSTEGLRSWFAKKVSRKTVVDE